MKLFRGHCGSIDSDFRDRRQGSSTDTAQNYPFKAPRLFLVVVNRHSFGKYPAILVVPPTQNPISHCPSVRFPGNRCRSKGEDKNQAPAERYWNINCPVGTCFVKP